MRTTEFNIIWILRQTLTKQLQTNTPQKPKSPHDLTGYRIRDIHGAGAKSVSTTLSQERHFKQT